MKNLLLSLFAFAAPVLPVHAAPLAARAVVADDPLPPDKRPEVAQLIDKLKGHVEKKGNEDTQAVEVIDKLLPEFQASGPKDKAAIVAALSKCFEARRLEGQDGMLNNKLYLATATALGTMGPESTKELTKWIEHKSLRKDLGLQHRLILSLGKTKDKDAIDRLILLLENKENSLISAAGEALGEFAEHDLETRKKAFEGLLKVLMSAKNSVDANATDQTARDKYDVISAPIITSLTKLSKQEIRDPNDWQRFWNKNKNKNWDSDK